MLKNEIISYYNIRKDLIKEELLENISSKGSFSITLDAWTAINQDAYLGVTM